MDPSDRIAAWLPGTETERGEGECRVCGRTIPAGRDACEECEDSLSIPERDEFRTQAW